MQSNFNGNGASGRVLSELFEGDQAILEGFDLPEEESTRLMELGFLPGHAVQVCKSAPGGDPRIFRVDGSQVALRRETTRHIRVRSEVAVAR